MLNHSMNRRDFLTVSGKGAAFLSAAGLAGSGSLLSACASAQNASRVETQAIVDDVLDYSVQPGDWPGAFGHVTMRLHGAVHRSGTAWFIRTDASDEDFASRHGLVHVPLLGQARDGGYANELFLREEGYAPVMRSVPPASDFSPLFHIKEVRGNPRNLDSAEAIREAERTGMAEVIETGVFVNYPLIAWPGGQLPVDEAREEYLGGGQLLEPLDTGSGQVTLKLHEAFPGSYYLVTDASLGGPAEMMSVPVSAPLDQLAEAGGTDKVWVFTNGVEGSGVMGYQPAVFGNPAGHPAWSPYWDHFALTWNDEQRARVLGSASEIRTALEENLLTRHDGTPATPRGFVVNCPVPVTGGNRTEA